MSSRGETDRALRWLHCWAILTALATLPLLLLGAEVTTKQVGMADPVWPTAPWHLFGVEWDASGIGYLIEHSHRLAGYVVGCCTIVLALAAWYFEPRRWVRWLGWLALIGVCIQGLLGGFRVRLHALVGTDLAMIHGVFGQVVFTLLVTMAMVTSRRWRDENLGQENELHPGLWRWTNLLTLLLVIQLILGAVVRHQGWLLAQRLHILTAFGAVALVAWLFKMVMDHHAGERRLVRPVQLLAGLIALQVALGVEAWLVRFGTAAPLTPGHWLFSRELARSGHVLIGSMVLAASVVLTVEAYRRSTVVVSQTAGWEGAA